MLDSRLISLVGATLFATTAIAQSCTFNDHELHLVDPAGAKFAEQPYYPGEDISESPGESVYVAFSSTTPSGLYYVHVISPLNGNVNDAVLSTNDPMDRFVQIDNVNGVISLSLPFSTDPGSAVFGAGLNGIGQSLPLGPLAKSTGAAGECTFYVRLGKEWDLTNGPENPYLLSAAPNPITGECSLVSFQAFQIGDGTGSSVSGRVFADDDRSGAMDGTESGVAALEVQLLSDNVQLTALTDADGRYSFTDVTQGEWTVEVPLPGGYVATTASSESLAVCGCGDVDASNVGIDVVILPSNAKPRNYWRSNRGATEAVDAGILPTLPMLAVVNTWGCFVSPSSKWQFRSYLRWANSWNMAYSLSGQLVTMQANVVTGRVHVDSVVNDPRLGMMTVGQLMQQAAAAILADSYTPPCSGSGRQEQRRLRNALWRSSKNRIWQ